MVKAITAKGKTQVYILEIKESKEDSILIPQISSTKETNSQKISLSSKAMADDKDSTIKVCFNRKSTKLK